MAFIIFGKIKYLPETLLLTEVAKPLHKTIALAVKARGTKIVGFYHGNNIGNLWEKTKSYVEYSHCDYFVCPTAKSAELHNKRHSLSGISRVNRTTFVSAETSYYKNLKENCENDPFPSKFKTVMIIGVPMHPFRRSHTSANYFLFQLDIELRIATLLKKQGYKVIYKMHPDRKDEAEGIFDDLADNILTEPFESVYKEADAFFFGQVTSSTFGFALCTNKPIFCN